MACGEYCRGEYEESGSGKGRGIKTVVEKSGEIVLKTAQ